ncbi:glycosyltransferase family 2 protein [Baia soyae]|uniref:Glycosyltransferase involved in cell wall biosynthesis n=1 Tax=Baia soyae TaxID=1544746 RepID=A0A4R2RNK7_9BACL|nr:glycosyltransferase family 2 protein [Baia soyae]TCP64588.1 glycosyltransferase involved in cell wall biosynthesis [Baia soyae]
MHIVILEKHESWTTDLTIQSLKRYAIDAQISVITQDYGSELNKIRSCLSDQEILVVCQSGDTFHSHFFKLIAMNSHHMNSYRGIIIIHEGKKIPVVFFRVSHGVTFSEWNKLPFQHYVREDQLRYYRDNKWIYWNIEECGYIPSTRSLPWEKREEVEKLILPILQPNHHKVLTNINPIVTIGIATYQMGHMLMWALQSIKNQTNPNWHLLVYDDGSTDSTTNVLQNEVHDPRITVLRGKENKGKAHAFNQILSHTRTPWLMELDSDDWLAPHAIQSIYKATDQIKEKKAHFLYGNYYLWEQGKRELRYRGIQISPKLEQIEHIIQSGIVVCPRIYSTDSLFKMNAWDVEGRLYEDLELLYRLKMNQVSAVSLSSPIYHRRLHSSSVTHQAKKSAYSKWLMDLKSKSSI